MTKKILQIIPANGVSAVYTIDGSKKESWPVVCWALCEEEDKDEKEIYQFVEGMIVVSGSQWLVGILEETNKAFVFEEYVYID